MWKYTLMQLFAPWPRTAGDFFERAQAHAWREANYAAALDDLEQAMRLAESPSETQDMTQLIQLRAECYEQLNEHTKALDDLQALAREYGGEDPVVLDMARCHLALGNLKTAEGLCRDAIAGTDIPTDEQVLLARVLFARDDHDAALRLINQAIETSQREWNYVEPEFHFQRAVMLANSKEYAGALTDCQQSVQGGSDAALPLTEDLFDPGMSPHIIDALDLSALCLRELGRDEEAETAQQQADTIRRLQETYRPKTNRELLLQRRLDGANTVCGGMIVFAVVLTIIGVFWQFWRWPYYFLAPLALAAIGLTGLAICRLLNRRLTGRHRFALHATN